MKKSNIFIILATCILLPSLSGCTSQNSTNFSSTGANNETKSNYTNNTIEGASQNSSRNNTESNTKTASPSSSESNNDELFIYKLFKGSKTNNDDTKKILSALQNINWNKYDQISKGKAVDLIDWLYTLGITDNEDIVSVLNATNGLDGAIAEGYSGIVANLFTADVHKFIKCLGQLELSKVKSVCPLVAYGCGYTANEKSKQIIFETKMLLNNSDLTDKEKEVTSQLIKAFESVVK